MAKKTVESRAEGYKQAWAKYLDLVDEAEARGDLKALRRKYGWQMLSADFFSRLTGKMGKRAYIRIDLR